MLYEAETVRSFNRATGFESQDFAFKIGLFVQKRRKKALLFQSFSLFLQHKWKDC